MNPTNRSFTHLQMASNILLDTVFLHVMCSFGCVRHQS